MSKVKIDLLEGKNTNEQLTLCINNNRVAGIKSGYGYELIKTWNVNKEDLLEIINSSTQAKSKKDLVS